MHTGITVCGDVVGGYVGLVVSVDGHSAVYSGRGFQVCCVPAIVALKPAPKTLGRSERASRNGLAMISRITGGPQHLGGGGTAGDLLGSGWATCWASRWGSIVSRGVCL